MYNTTKLLLNSRFTWKNKEKIKQTYKKIGHFILISQKKKKEKSSGQSQIPHTVMLYYTLNIITIYTYAKI